MTNTENMGSTQRLVTYIREGIVNPRILKFGVVGVSGIGVNMGTLYLLTEFARIPYFIGSLIAIELSILSNFWLNHIWTWKDRSEFGTVLGKVVRYHVGAGLTAILGNYLVLIALTEFFGINYLISNLIGIGVGTLGNFVINDLWTFKTGPQPQ
jgi:dolichol-phosphate mannosyltransferase